MTDRYARGTRWRNPRTGTVWRVNQRWTSGHGGFSWVTLVSLPRESDPPHFGRGSVRHYLPNEIDELGLVPVEDDA